MSVDRGSFLVARADGRSVRRSVGRPLDGEAGEEFSSGRSTAKLRRVGDSQRSQEGRLASERVSDFDLKPDADKLASPESKLFDCS